MITLKEILNSRGLENCILPIWKLRITESEYTELKETLRSAIINNEIISFQMEATLYYAEWWRREYNGGSPSTESLIYNLGFKSSYSEEFYIAAKSGAKQLKIDFINRRGRNYYFRTMLLQGGLPINHIRNNEGGFNGYKKFLLGLVKEVQSLSIDWNDISFIETLPCSNYLPISFCNEGIFNLSLQIAHAIVEDREDLLPYDSEDSEWKKLTEELKNEISKERNRVPFLVNWELQKKDNLSLYYYIENAKKIDSQTIVKTKLSGCYSFSLYVQDKYIASYRRMNESSDSDYYYLRMDNHPEKFLWKGESVINIQLKGDNETIYDITAPKCFAPDFSSPQVFQKFENKWLLKSNRKESFENAILFTDEWLCKDNLFEIEKLSLIDKVFSWVEFQDFVTLVNTVTNEETTYDNKVSTYFIEFLNWTLNWIEEANYKVLVNNPEIRVYDSDHEIVNAKCYEVYYKKYKTSEWKLFKGFGLPTGLLEFKIELPDKKFEIEKFFYLDNLQCQYLNMNSDSGEIVWKLQEGVISGFSEDGLQIKQEALNHFYIEKQKDITKYPEAVQFRIQIFGMPSLKIRIASPFRGVNIVNCNGIELNDGEIIALDSLRRFKIIVLGYDEITTEIYYQKSKEDQPESVIIREKIKSGIHSLSLYNEQINKMFELYGYNSFNRKSSVQMYFGVGKTRKHIEIRRFDLDSYINENCEVHVTRDFLSNSIKNPFKNLRIDEFGNISLLNENESKIVSDYYGDIWMLPVDVSPNEINIEKMVRNNDHFSRPENHSFKKIIVFSDYQADEKIVPKFYDFDEPQDFPQEQRKIQSITNIEEMTEVLLEENGYQGESWEKVLIYFKIILQQQLPFRTLNYFSSIAGSANLMVRMLFAISLKLDKEEWISGIIKFENEFATSYHWIKTDIWNIEFEKLLNSVPDILKNEVIKVCAESQKTVIEATLNSNTGDLIRFAYQGVKCKNIPTITRSDIQNMRSKIIGRTGNNQDLPMCKVSNSEKFFDLEGANGYQVTCLLSPVKAAESLMGKNDDLWKYDDESMKLRRVINFYRSYQSEVYNEILTAVVKKINALDY